MDAHQIQLLRKAMAYEGSRSGPPAGFPKFADIPGGRYTDPRFYALEKDHLWRKSWLIAAHLDEIPEPGSFKLWEMAGQPVVILRTRTGGVNAFYNTCSHRGGPLVREASGKRPRLVCGYHGWTYDDEGKLIGLRDQKDFVDLDLSCRSLKQVKCELIGNLIFVNFDPEAVPLRERIGPILKDWEEFQLGSLRLVDRYTIDLKCNWKIAMEANLEVYHVKSIHPQTVDALIDPQMNVNTLYEGGHARMVSPNRPGIDKGAIRGGGHSFKDIPSVGEIARTCTQSYNLLPNWVSPLSEFGFPALVFWPTGIDTAQLEVWWFGADWGGGQRPVAWDHYITRFNTVLEEDTQFGNWIQKSVSSYGFEGVPLSYQEARIYHWHEAADRVIGPENIPSELRVVPAIGKEWIYPEGLLTWFEGDGIAAE